ncbi:MAG: hypothetical protein J07HN6_00215 [Halonotius sp. J07HN6]|nr:MAG: hypothetical protein J07HN6_00215 [Halonotius sp. J07HN6]
MPVIGETSVIVEAVDDTYERLHKGFAAQPGAVADDADQAVAFDFDLAVNDA